MKFIIKSTKRKGEIYCYCGDKCSNCNQCSTFCDGKGSCTNCYHILRG